MKYEPISVVIPAFNREQYIGEAIESVLAQGIDDLEIIVVDNNSTDETVAVAQRYPKVRVLRELSQGISFAANTGVKAATGTWLAFLDSDDVWMPGKLTAQFEALEGQPVNVYALGLSQNFLDPNTSADQLPNVQIETRPVPGFHMSAMLIRTEVFLKVGLLDETLKVAPPIDWFMRAMDTGLEPLMLNEVVHRRRVHADNIARDRSAADYMMLVRKALQRRRNQEGSANDHSAN